MNGKHILIIDDERPIREMVCLALRQGGFECSEASNAHEAQAMIEQQSPGLILLDWMMPGVSGVELARSLRRQEKTRHLPIIMLTARSEEDDLIKGLDSGADDYLTKPFSTRELLARIHALLRRLSPNEAGSLVEVGGLQLDTAAQRVYARGRQLELAPTEFRLLHFFMTHTERVFSREQVLNSVWGENIYVEERTVDVHIRRLRKALAPAGYDRFVQTVRGSGYRFSSQH